MNSSKEEMKELSTLIEQIGNELTDEHHVKFSELFAELNLYDDDNDGPIPLENMVGSSASRSRCFGISRAGRAER
jgi:Ca2+-binding EF-hand superfamily protein